MSERFHRARASRWFDPALAVLLTCPPLFELAARPDLTSAVRAPILVVVLGATVAIRRTHPLVAAGVQALVFVSTPGFDDNFLPDSGVGVVLVVAYSCGVHATRNHGLAAAAVLAAGQQIGMGFSEFPNFEVYFVTLVPWWVGLQVARRHRLVRELRARTAQLEAEQDVFARLAVRRERARIARELHDIVAHNLAVIAVQAGAGRMAPRGQGDDDAERFATIRHSASQALEEMARLVDILEDDRRPGLERLRVLVDEAVSGGVELSFTPLSAAIRLPAEVEEVAYRAVQEGLTNALKHAPGAAVQVRLAARGNDLEVEVLDGGAAGRSDLARTGAGAGLAGMRERVESLGGSLEAGPVPGGGWRLGVRVPTPLAAAVPPAG